MPGDYSITVDLANPLPPGFKEGDPIPPPKFKLPEEYTVRGKSSLKATIKPGQNEPLNFELK